MTESVFSICGMCTVRCPIQVEVEDGVVKWIEGNPQDPGMAGRLCAKGSAGVAMLYDYERPQHPLIREGKRGEGKWKEVTWDEALDYTFSRLKEIKEAHGSDSIAFLASAKVTNEENYIIMKFARAAVGTNNVDHCARL